MAKIRNLRVIGLFSFGNETNVNFGNKNLIIGPNNSGKTNIFRIFNTITKTMIDPYRIDLDVKCNNESDWAELEFQLEISEDEATILAKFLFLGSNNDDLAHYERYEHLLQDLVTDFRELSIKIQFSDYAKDEFRSIITINSKSFVFYQKQNYGYLQMSSKKTFPDVYNPNVNDQYFYQFLDENFEVAPDYLKEVIKYFDLKNIIIPLKDIDGNNLHPHENKFYNLAQQKLKFNIRNKNNFLNILGHILKNSINYVSEKRNFQMKPLKNSLEVEGDASNLAIFLSNLKNGTKSEQFYQIKEQFSKVFSKKMQFDVLQNINDEDSKISEVTPYLVFQKNEIVFKHNQVGFGVLEVLLLLTISRTQKNSIVLMDEPTLHLHPVQTRLTFDEILENIEKSESQLFVISHSTILPYAKFLASKKDEIVYVRMNEKYTSISQPSLEKRKELMKKIPKLEYDLNPEIFFGRSVILFEGDAELGLLQGIDERRNLEATLNDIIFLPTNSKDNLPTYVELLKAFDIPFSAFVDKDAITRITRTGKSAVLEAINSINSKLVKNFFQDLEDCIDKTKQPYEYKEKYFEKLIHFAESQNIFIIKEGRIEEMLKKIDENLQSKLKKDYGRSTRLYTKYFARLVNEEKIKQFEAPIQAYEKALKISQD